MAVSVGFVAEALVFYWLVGKAWVLCSAYVGTADAIEERGLRSHAPANTVLSQRLLGDLPIFIIFNDLVHSE